MAFLKMRPRYHALSLVFVMLIGASPCFAQQNMKRYTDSLYIVVQQSLPKQDTNTVSNLSKYSRTIRFDSADKAVYYANEAISLAKKLKSEYWGAEGLSSLSMVYDRLGKVDSAVIYADSARKIFIKYEKYEPAIFCLALKSSSLRNKGRYAEAIDVRYESAKYAEKIGNKTLMARAYGDIALIYGEVGMHNEAILNLKQALESFKQLRDTISLGFCHESIGERYLHLKRYAEARAEFDTALNLYAAIGRFDAVAWIKPSLALSMAQLKEYAGAIKLAKEGIEETAARKSKLLLAQAFANSAKIILLGTESRRDTIFNYDTALQYGEKALELYTEIGYIGGQVAAMEILSQVHAHQKNYAKAYELQNRYVAMKDSIAGSHKVQEVAIKETQFDNQKKEAVLIATHSVELKQQKIVRNTLIAGAGIILLAAGSLFWSYKRRRDARSKQQEAELKAQVADTEMKVMRLQMNPHFIFNSLNSIGDYIRKNNSAEADEYLSKFAKVMRMTLENSEQQAISLEDDLKALELYMQLEAKRLNDKFTYEIKVADDIDKENTLVPPMIFQPFVENSIWHGISKKEGKGHILLEIRKDEDMLHCVIDDDGVGRERSATIREEVETKKQSFGMKITRARIDILNRLKKSKASVQLMDKSQGLTAELKLPLENNF